MAESKAGSSHPVVVLSDLAESDSFEIIAYTAEFWGAERAEDMRLLLSRSMRLLAENPRMAPLVPNLKDVRSQIVRWKNASHGHRIFYQETDGGIYVLRILHTSMNWTDLPPFDDPGDEDS